MSLAERAAVEKKDRKNWNTILNRAHDNLREKKGGFVGSTDEDEVYFSEIIGMLRNFNVAWRYPSSHIPITFSEPKARKLFSIAHATMEHLSQRLNQVEMPPAEE
jgi:hypothetical protein